MNVLWAVVIIVVVGVAFLVTLIRKAKSVKCSSPTPLPKVKDPASTHPLAAADEFIVFDLETTGLDPHHCEIIEIGAIRIDPRSLAAPTGTFTLRAFSTLVRPMNPIPRHIIHINGITQDMVDKNGRELSEVLPLFLEFIGDLPLVAYNASFDLGFLSAATAKEGLRMTNDGTCALKMMRKAWPNLPSYKLEVLSRKLNLPNTFNLTSNQNHRALADCQRTAILYSTASSELGLTSLGV